MLRSPPFMRLQWILLLAIAAVALMVRIYPVYVAVLGGEEVNFLETDASYHVRLAESQVRNYPWRVTVDPYAAAGGQFVPVAPLYDTLTSTAVVLRYGPQASTIAIERIAAYGPPVLGTLAVVAAWALGAVLFGSRAGLMGAAMLATMPGHFLDRTMLGFVDHHALEALLALLTLVTLARACPPAGESTSPSVSPALLAGLALGLYLLTWGSGAFLVAILGLWLFIVVLQSRSRADVAAVARVLLITVLVAGALVLLFQDPRMYRYGTQVFALAGLAALSAIVLLVSRRLSSLPSRTMLLAALAGGLAVSVLVAWGWKPGLIQQVAGDLLRLTPDRSRMAVLEARPLFRYSGDWHWAQPWQFFGTGFHVGLCALLLFTGKLVRDRRPGDALLWSFAVATLVATLGQNRFGYYLVPALALLNGWLADYVLQWGGWFRDRSAARHLDVPLQREVALLAVVAVMFAPNLTPKLLERRSAGVSQFWLDAMFWLRQHTPEPFAAGEDYYYARYGRTVPAPDYTIMNWWDQGYLITQRARRVPVANPTQEQAGASARFWAETDESRAVALLGASRARYVVADWELPFRVTTEGRVMGRFQSVLDWAGYGRDVYYEVCYRRSRDGWTPVWVYKEPYYQSMVFRLMVAGGSAVGPRKITVITTTDRVDTRGMPFREIVTERPFTSYEDAQRAASAASALQATIVGLDPRESPFPLDALTSLARVHDVRQLGQQSSDPWARIFQVGAQGR
jgi:oligosaccharyl transferase (archaeosortase A-associated)